MPFMQQGLVLAAGLNMGSVVGCRVCRIGAAWSNIKKWHYHSKVTTVEDCRIYITYNVTGSIVASGFYGGTD